MSSKGDENANPATSFETNTKILSKDENFDNIHGDTTSGVSTHFIDEKQEERGSGDGIHLLSHAETAREQNEPSGNVENAQSVDFEASTMITDDEAMDCDDRTDDDDGMVLKWDDDDEFEMADDEILASPKTEKKDDKNNPTVKPKIASKESIDEIIRMIDASVNDEPEEQSSSTVDQILKEVASIPTTEVSSDVSNAHITLKSNNESTSKAQESTTNITDIANVLATNSKPEIANKETIDKIKQLCKATFSNELENTEDSTSNDGKLALEEDIAIKNSDEIVHPNIEAPKSPKLVAGPLPKDKSEDEQTTEKDKSKLEAKMETEKENTGEIKSSVAVIEEEINDVSEDILVATVLANSTTTKAKRETQEEQNSANNTGSVEARSLRSPDTGLVVLTKDETKNIPMASFGHNLAGIEVEPNLAAMEAELKHTSIKATVKSNLASEEPEIIKDSKTTAMAEVETNLTATETELEQTTAFVEAATDSADTSTNDKPMTVIEPNILSAEAAFVTQTEKSTEATDFVEIPSASTEIGLQSQTKNDLEKDTATVEVEPMEVDAKEDLPSEINKKSTDVYENKKHKASIDQMVVSEDETVDQLKSVEEPKTSEEVEVASADTNKSEDIEYIEKLVPDKSTEKELLQPTSSVVEATSAEDKSLAKLTETDDKTVAEDKSLNKDKALPSTSVLKEIGAKTSVPSTSKDEEEEPRTSELTSYSKDKDELSSSFIAYVSDEVAEVNDSLGLLAESSVNMEEEEQEDIEDTEDQTSEHDDDDEEFDPDDESNQMTAYHSEDSNAQHSETDIKEKSDKDNNIQPSDESNGDSMSAFEKGAKEKSKISQALDIHTEKDIAASSDESNKKSEAIDTVKLSDTSDSDENSLKDSKNKKVAVNTSSGTIQVAKGIQKLEISQPQNVMNFVDLDGSSDDDSAPPPAASDAITTTARIKRHSTSESTNKVASVNDTKKPVKDTKVSKDSSKPAEVKVVKIKPKVGLEVFSLDSDEEDAPAKAEDIPPTKCINIQCKNECNKYIQATSSTAVFFESTRKKKPMVCTDCADIADRRAQTLINGIINNLPLLDIDSGREYQELVEISDSDEEGEGEVKELGKEGIGEEAAKFIEAELADMINLTWKKFKMEDRVTEMKDYLNNQLSMLEDASAELKQKFNECQIATDKLRNDLYATFEVETKSLPSIIIQHTPEGFSSLPESEASATSGATKRRLTSTSETPNKRQAGDFNILENALKSLPADDDRDVSVVHLSTEQAPADLPPPGDLVRPPLWVGQWVFAMRNNVACSWLRAKVIEVFPRVPGSNMATHCRVRIGEKTSKTFRTTAKALAYAEPAEARMTIGTRVIALFTNSGFFSGIVAEVPNPVNKYRYLIFFDDGYAQYARHADTRLVCEYSPQVWDEVQARSREFVKNYLAAYPERPMVRLHKGQTIKVERNGKWFQALVMEVDASLVRVRFEEKGAKGAPSDEWIYRGSTRLATLFRELQAAAERRQRARALPRNRLLANAIDRPYVEYTRSDEQNKTQATQQEDQSRQRAVAKKSTGPTPVTPAAPDAAPSRIVYYTPKNAVRPYKMATHICGPRCRRTDVLALKDLRTYNPLARPLLSGWERQLVRFKGLKEVMYLAPCGRRLRNMWELHKYLRVTQSEMGVDLFDFNPITHCLSEFVLNKCIVGIKDLSHGKENVPVTCANYYDDTLPEFCSYNTERTPTEGVPLNLDPEFLCGCDCTDDCEDKSKCACWQLTLEGARTIGLTNPNNVGYKYKRLPEPLPSGIYECNSRCKCKHTCLNRVAQHPLQLKLQVFKTLHRGWGIRALNDVPKGAFLCVYAGNLLTDATANLDGLNEGDEYLAELDYIEVVEAMKQGYEDDIPDADKETDSSETASEEETEDREDKEGDGDFEPGLMGMVRGVFNKKLRKRKKDTATDEKNKEGDRTREKESGEEDCITISDDEDNREPALFMADPKNTNLVSKHRSVRWHYGKDEACYIMDAKVQGNIGRYLNHSCAPNVFVQNVFVDTHDPRFPWVAFFALCHIKTGTELTWNYNYDVGSVPGKALTCYCGAPNCRGRLL